MELCQTSPPGRDLALAGLMPFYPSDRRLRPRPRSDATARLLWSRIPTAYRTGNLSTDHLESYHNVLPPQQHHATYGRGPTNYIERFNNTLRQRLGRLVRKTLSFSKCPVMHESVIRLFLHRYNLDRLQT